MKNKQTITEYFGNFVAKQPKTKLSKWDETLINDSKMVPTAKRFQSYCTVAYLVFQCLSRLNRLSPTSILKKIDKTRQESAPSLYACLQRLMNQEFTILEFQPKTVNS